jgi:hypothetical protein
LSKLRDQHETLGQIDAELSAPSNKCTPAKSFKVGKAKDMVNGADQEERKDQILFWGAIWLSSVGRKDILPAKCLAQGEDMFLMGTIFVLQCHLFKRFHHSGYQSRLHPAPPL